MFHETQETFHLECIEKLAGQGDPLLELFDVSETVDSCNTFGYVARICRSAEAREKQVQLARLTAKLFLGLALAAGFCCSPLCAQSEAPYPQAFSPKLTTERIPSSGESGHTKSIIPFRTYSMPELAPGYIASQMRNGDLGFRRVAWTSSPNTIEKMEAAFYCNDTPFVDQVRLPLATFWNGRVKLIGFESDVTTANFVMGLPGQGALHNLSAFGNAFIATHTPPSDQLAGIHMTISLRAKDTDAGENSGRRGIEYLVRASRGFLPFLSARSDSISFPSR
jgi:hypothetical protein